MSWKTVTNIATDIKKYKGKVFTGEYKGSHKIDTKLGEQVVWDFIGEDGLGFGVYGFTNLNRCMEVVPEGSVVRIIYMGTENVQTKYGMKDCHQVMVEIFEEEGKGELKEEKNKIHDSDLPF